VPCPLLRVASTGPTNTMLSRKTLMEGGDLVLPVQAELTAAIAAGTELGETEWVWCWALGGEAPGCRSRMSLHSYSMVSCWQPWVTIATISSFKPSVLQFLPLTSCLDAALSAEPPGWMGGVYSRYISDWPDDLLMSKFLGQSRGPVAPPTLP
jgi:hypothetical protein